MFCAKCGRELRDGDRFCPSCGEPVRGISMGVDEPKESSNKVSREHIYFDWDNLDMNKKNSTSSDVIFDWGRGPVGERNPINNSGLFTDKNLVERETRAISLDEAKNRATGLRDEHQEEKANIESKENGLTGLYDVVSDLASAPKKTLYDLENELFSTYGVSPEKKEETLETKVETPKETIGDKIKNTLPRGAFANILAKIKSEQDEMPATIKEEKAETNENPSSVIPSSFADIIKNIKKNEEETEIKPVEEMEIKPVEENTEPVSTTENKEEEKENIEEVDKQLEEAFFLYKQQGDSVEELKEKAIASELTEEDKASIDDILEQTIIYNKKDLEEAISNEEELIDTPESEEPLENTKEEEPKDLDFDSEFSNLENVREYPSSTFVNQVTNVAISDAVSEAIEDTIEEIEEVKIEIKEAVSNALDETLSLEDVSPIDTSDLPERLDEKFLTFARKNEEFNDLLNKEKERIESLNEESDSFETKEDTIEVDNTAEVKEEVEMSIEEEVFNNSSSVTPKEEEEFTQSVDILADIANSLNNKKEEENEPKVEENEKPVPRVTKMTLTGLDLDQTFDFDDTTKLKEVQTDVLNDVFDLSNMESLKEDLDNFYKDDNEPKKKKKHIIVKIIIFLLIILILFEAAIVVTKYIAPTSKIAILMSGIFEKALNFIENIF